MKLKLKLKTKFILFLLLLAFQYWVNAFYLVAYSKLPPKITDYGTVECYPFHNTTFTVCKIKDLPKTFDNMVAINEDMDIQLSMCQDQAPWHLNRLSQRTPFVWDGVYVHPGNANNNFQVGVYILDTYVDVKHHEFENRAQRVFSNQYTVSNPHGTHVAGLVASKTFGVNKGARIFSVEVLDDNGRGAWSKLVEGLSFVSKHAAQRSHPSVINISISGSASPVIDAVIEVLYKQGILTVVAAGNENEQACNYSPAKSKLALTVAASTWDDQLSDFSNWGSCVDVIAPGTYIASTLPQGKSGFMSGTSMAAPLVAGIASLMLEMNPNLTAYSLTEFIKKKATRDAVKNPKQTPNLVAYQPYGLCPRLMLKTNN